MDGELEEGEILDEKSPTKRARWSKSFGNEDHLPYEYVGVLKRKRKAYKRHVCKSHKKFPKKENKPLIKNESIRTVRRIEPNVTSSKSVKNNYVTQKNSAPHPSVNKSSHNCRSSVNSSKAVSMDHYPPVKRNDYFQCTSYRKRTSHSKMNIDTSYEDLLNQYKSIQSELASIHQKTPSWSSSKNSERRISHSKSNSSKKKKVKSPSIKCSFKHNKVVSSQNLNEVLLKKEKDPLEIKSSNFSKPEEEDDEDLDLLRRTALATCAKLPPSPIPIEAENDELEPNSSTLSFMGDNYEIVDMDVSSNCDDELSQDGSINGESSLNEVAQDGSIPDIEVDDDEDDEEVLRAQLILALNKSKQEEEDHEIIENYVESISRSRSIVEIDLVSTNSESEMTNEVAIPNDFQEDVHASVDIPDVLKNVSNTVPPYEEVKAFPENGCNTIDSTTFPKADAEVLLQSAVVSDLSNCSSTVNSLFDDVPNLISKEILSRNVILEHSYQKASLETVIENHIPPEKINKCAIAETEPHSVPCVSSSRTVIIENNNNIDLKHDHPSIHPALSVTCVSDNSKLRKVHVMKRKPLPYFSPVKPVIIKFDKDSSESESDTDVSTDGSNAQHMKTDGSMNAQCLSADENMAQKLERLIENAKNKSDSSSVQKVESKGTPPMQQAAEMESISPVSDSTTKAKEPEVRETIPKSEVQQDEKAQNIEAFHKVFNKLKLVESTYYKELMLYNNYKMVACKQKSLYITSVAEVLRLKEQLSKEEKLRNSHKNRMFEANEKVATTQQSMNDRMKFMDRLKADCLKEGIKVFGPNYTLPKDINSPFKFRHKPF